MNPHSTQAEPEQRRPEPSLLADRLAVLLPLLFFALVVLSGATPSHLGLDAMRQDPTDPLGTMIGDAQPIRSDEWRTQTSIEMGVLANGESSWSPLTHEPDLVFQVSSGGFFESVLFFEGNLLRLGAWLPDPMLFAAFRAFPWLLVMLCLPPLLQRFGATRRLSWLAVALCFFAPTTFWWSFQPFRILGYASAGCYLLVLAAHQLARPEGKRPVRAALLAGAGGILLARLATFYVPWCLTIGTPIAIATVAWLLAGAHRRAGLIVLGVGAGVGGLVLGGAFWENLDSLRAQFATLYPGLRRDTGAPTPPFQLLGAPGMFKAEGEPVPLLLNQSEIASAFLVCGLWAALLWRRMRPAADRASRVVLGVSAVLLGLWVSWCTLSWGSIGVRIPLLNLVPPGRAAQTVGLVAVLVLCLVLSRVDRVPTRDAAVIAVVCAAATAYGVSDLRHALATLDAGTTWAVSALTGALVFALTRWPQDWRPIAAAVTASALAVASVNPIVFGFGDLRDSDTATTVREYGARADERGELFVSDSGNLDALLAVNGAPSLTGFQITGPVPSQWAHLDPRDQYELQWNRGASAVVMAFDQPAGGIPVIENPGPDIVYVHVDPCWVAERPLGVRYVYSGKRLDYDCLELAEQLEWAGKRTFLYAIEG